jgi:hypothetical protein
MFLKNTLKKVHNVVDKGSKDIQALVEKAENFVSQTEDLIRESDNTIKIIGGFIIVAMGMQIIVSYTQFRVNLKMLNLIRSIKK